MNRSKTLELAYLAIFVALIFLLGLTPVSYTHLRIDFHFALAHIPITNDNCLSRKNVFAPL